MNAIPRETLLAAATQVRLIQKNTEAIAGRAYGVNDYRTRECIRELCHEQEKLCGLFIELATKQANES